MEKTMESMKSKEPPSGFMCTWCGAKFGRREHLDRHTVSIHSVERPFSCVYCSQSFARRDVLVRHLKSCKVKPDDGEPLPVSPKRRRGRKRKSCDACIRHKRACNGTQPCRSCVHRNQTCSFTEVDGTPEDSSTVAEPWPEIDNSFVDETKPPISPPDMSSELQDAECIPFQANHMHVPHVPIEQPALAPEPFSTPLWTNFEQELPNDPITFANAGGNVNNRLEFLANFTNTKGMASSFDCGTVEQRGFIMQQLLATSSIPESAQRREAYLMAKTHAIVGAMKEHVGSLSKRRRSGLIWSYNLEMTCCQFFAPCNLRRFLLSYWAFWHPNSPFIHKPTFEEQAAPASLIATMALIGACLSPAAGDRENALVWLDLVEEWVFSTPGFSDDPLCCDTEDLKAVQERLDALTAAYFVILLQTWEGGEDAKRRARRSRYTDVIGVFRSVCSKEVTHGDIQSSYLGFVQNWKSWKRFAVKEELIRVLTYVVLLDTAYVIFNNTPPRLALREARVALACPEACFQAEDVHNWEAAMKVWAESEIGRRQPLMCQVTNLLWTAPHPQSNDWSMLRQMSSLNMFIIIHPPHVQLFNVRCHPFPGNQTAFIRQALDNWRLIWMQRTGIMGLDETLPMNPSDCWKRVGFPRYALEYWCLADFILTSSLQITSEFDQNGVMNESVIAQLLNRYDESDMSQVRDLVNMLGSMTLGM